jgi:hypothetical protein
VRARRLPALAGEDTQRLRLALATGTTGRRF